MKEFLEKILSRGKKKKLCRENKIFNWQFPSAKHITSLHGWYKVD